MAAVAALARASARNALTGRKERCAMSSQRESDAGLVNHRRWPRVRLTAPVQLSTGAAESGTAVPIYTAQSRDVTTGGIYVTINECPPVAVGDFLVVSVLIPREDRRSFPFSRIVGLCRVVRVEEIPILHGQERGLGLAFCEDRVIMLGAMVFS